MISNNISAELILFMQALCLGPRALTIELTNERTTNDTTPIKLTSAKLKTSIQQFVMFWATFPN